MGHKLLHKLLHMEQDVLLSRMGLAFSQLIIRTTIQTFYRRIKIMSVCLGLKMLRMGKSCTVLILNSERAMTQHL